MRHETIAEEVRFSGDGRPVDALLVRPSTAGPHPALVLIHEIWGLDGHIRDVAGRFAAQGYVTLAPDLYTGPLREAMRPENIVAGMQLLRQAPPEVQRDPSRLRERLAELPEETRRAVGTLMEVMSPARRESFARDLVGAVGYLRGRPEVDPGRVGSLGFCMGGGLSARLTTLSPELRASVIFYGENPPLDAVPAIRAAVLGLYGGEDRRITDTVPDLVRAMAEAGRRFEHHIYPGAQHAFFNDTRAATYHAEAARDAWQRVLAFLGAELAVGS